MATKKKTNKFLDILTVEGFEEMTKAGTGTMGGEDNTVSVSVEYDVPQSIVDAIMDKIRDEAEEEATDMEPETVASRAIIAILDEFLNADNVSVESILTGAEDSEDSDEGDEDDMEDLEDLDAEEEGYDDMHFDSARYKRLGYIPSIREFMVGDYHNVFDGGKAEDAPKYGKSTGMDTKSATHQKKGTGYEKTLDKDTEHKYGGKTSMASNSHKAVTGSRFEKTRNYQYKNTTSLANGGPTGQSQSKKVAESRRVAAKRAAAVARAKAKRK